MSSKKKISRKTKNIIVFVVDKSSSIESYRIAENVRNFYNRNIESIKNASENLGHETLIGLVTFADTAKIEFYPQDIRNIKNLDDSNYQPYGNTALLDGIGLAVEMVESYEDSEYSFLINVITDGEENQSVKYRANGKIPKLIADKQALGNYTFTLNVPPGRADNLARSFGIPRENITEWEATTKGAERTTVHTQSAMGSYLISRSKGLRSVKNFYEVDVDLSDLNSKVLRKELTDRRNHFKVLHVDREVPIRSFVESQGYQYVVGASYYQLTKRELIQGNKEILVVEKGKGSVWAGPEARELVGLPIDGSDAYVEPFNLGDKELYCQSTSTNRKLVRGTKLLLDFKMNKHKSPTWADPDFVMV